MLKIFIILNFSIFILQLCSGCKKDLTPADNTQTEIKLTVEDVGVTEAWLQLSLQNPNSKNQVTIIRDDSTIKQFNNSTSDTIIYDPGLLPNHDYTYTATLLTSNQRQVSSIQITTMDTTSHDFTWDIYTFGDVGSNVLLDAAIIDENNIWIVGEIDVQDTLGSWTSFNAVHWDGNKWELKQIPFIGSCSAVDYPPLKAIYAFSDNHILFTNGGSIAVYDSISTQLDCGMNSLLAGAIYKIFAFDPNNIYAVGGAGSVVSYNGTQWQSVISGTDLGLLDIYGNSENTLYSCGVNYSSGEGIVLKYNGSKFEKMIEGFYHATGFDSTKLFISQLYGPIDGLWVDEFNTVYAVGHFIYQHKKGKWGYVKGIKDNKLNGMIYSRGYLHGIRGSAVNNIVIVGERGTLLHFNGMTWKQIGSPFDFNSEYDWYRVAVSENCITAVGKKGTAAAVIKLHY